MVIPSPGTSDAVLGERARRPRLADHKRARARSAWNETLCKHGIMGSPSDKVDVTSIVLALFRMRSHRMHAQSREVAVAAAGRLWMSFTAHAGAAARKRWLRSQQFVSANVLMRATGRVSTERGTDEALKSGLSPQEIKNSETITGMPGVTGIRQLVIAQQLLQSADEWPSKCAECDCPGVPGCEEDRRAQDEEGETSLYQDPDDEAFYCAACWAVFDSETPDSEPACDPSFPPLIATPCVSTCANVCPHDASKTAPPPASPRLTLTGEGIATNALTFEEDVLRELDLPLEWACDLIDADAAAWTDL